MTPRLPAAGRSCASASSPVRRSRRPQPGGHARRELRPRRARPGTSVGSLAPGQALTTRTASTKSLRSGCPSNPGWQQQRARPGCPSKTMPNISPGLPLVPGGARRTPRSPWRAAGPSRGQPGAQQDPLARRRRPRGAPRPRSRRRARRRRTASRGTSGRARRGPCGSVGSQRLGGHVDVHVPERLGHRHRRCERPDRARRRARLRPRRHPAARSRRTAASSRRPSSSASGRGGQPGT